MDAAYVGRKGPPMTVRVIPLSEIPTTQVKGKSVYRTMPEWAEAVHEIERQGRKMLTHGIEIELSAASKKRVKCKFPSQQLARFFRRHLRELNYPLQAYSLGPRVYIVPEDAAPKMRFTKIKKAPAPKKAPKQPHPHKNVQFKAKACTRCGREFIPLGPRSKFCGLEDCGAVGTARLAEKLPRKRNPRNGRAQLEHKPSEIANSEHREGISLTELRKLAPYLMVVSYARAHNGLFDVSQAWPMFEATGRFANPRELVALLEDHEDFVKSTHQQLTFQLSA